MVDSTARAGARIAGRYELEKLLGKGGMAEVWQARHLALNAKVAVKLLDASLAADESMRRRFVTEAQVAAQLKTRYAVQVFDFGFTDEGQPFLVMELLEGETLAARLRRTTRISPRATAVLFSQIARALDRAHAQGVVHRDLKPENLFVVKDDEGRDVAKVVDFGIAKLLGTVDDSPSSSTLRVAGGAGGAGASRAGLTSTAPGKTLGTPSYMAPEQIVGGVDLGAATDVWALGVVAFECLTGRRPFDAPDVGALFALIRSGEHPPAVVLDRDIPEAFDRWFDRACAREPLRRFASASDAAHALAVALGVADLPELAQPANEEEEAPLALPLDARATMSVTVGKTTSRSRGPRIAVALVALGGAVFVVAAAASVRALLHRGAKSGAAASVAPPVAASAGGGAAPSLALVSAPAILDDRADCESFPFFAADGTLVYYVATSGKPQSLYRVAPGTREPVKATDCPTTCRYPGPGDGDNVTFSRARAGQVADFAFGPLGGGEPTSLADHVVDGWMSGGFLYLEREDTRGLRRRARDGSSEDVLYEAPSATTFDGVTVSPDGQWLATSVIPQSARATGQVCIGPTAPGGALDCTTFGATTAERAAFAPSGALYFARGTTLVRLDRATRATQSAPLPFAPTSLAISPKSDRVVLSSCAARFDLARVFPAPATASSAELPSLPDSGMPSLGPHGELAFPLQIEGDAQVAVTDRTGGNRRVLTTGPHQVTEASYSPDATMLVFRDASPDTGGLFVIEADDARSPRRLTSDPGDANAAWIDGGHIVFLHPQAGTTYGQAEVVAVDGGDAEKVGGGTDLAVFGTVPADRAMLVFETRNGADAFYEQTLDGKRRPLKFAGAPADRRFLSYAIGSASGRYIAWTSDSGSAWIADLRTMRAHAVTLDDPGHLRALMVDDDGGAVAVWKRKRGALYDAPGVFP